jgi:hypothetical protein
MVRAAADFVSSPVRGVMRAEIQAVVDEIRESLALLRRFL